MASSSTTPSSSTVGIFDSEQLASTATATHHKTVSDATDHSYNINAANTNKNVSQVYLNSINSEPNELKLSGLATTPHVGTTSLLSLPVLKHSTTTSSETTPKSNIISLVTLKSPQNHQKLFPWSLNDTNNTINNTTGTVLTNFNHQMNATTSNNSSNNPGSPSSNSGSPPLSFNSIKYQNNTSHNSIGTVVETASNPKILRQQVMLGNNNRLNFAHLTNNRTTNDSIHVVLKKSSNQTIVIVSKPPSAPSTTQTVQSHQNITTTGQSISSPVQQQQKFMNSNVTRGGVDENKSDIMSKFF